MSPAAPQPGLAVLTEVLHAAGLLRRARVAAASGLLLGTFCALSEGLGLALGAAFVQASLTTSSGEPAGLVAVTRLGAWLASGLSGLGLGQTQTLAVLVGALLLARFVADVGYREIQSSFRQRLGDALRNRIVGRFMRRPMIGLRTSAAGDLASNLVNEAWMVTEAYGALVRQVVALCAAAVFGLMLAIVSWQLALLALAAAVVAGIVSLIHGRRARRDGAIAATAFHQLTETAVATSLAIRTIRAFGVQAQWRARSATQSLQARSALRRVESIHAVSGPVFECMVLGSLVLLGVFGGAMSVEAAQGVAFIALSARLFPQLREAHTARMAWHTNAAGLPPVRAALLAPVVKQRGVDHAPRAPSDTTDHRIRFDNVRVDDSGVAVLHGVSFELPLGRTTVVLGESGSGKSTVLNLLLGLLDPTAGTVRWQGIPLADIGTDRWAAKLAAAGQGFELVAGTLLENVAYGDPAPDATKVAAVLGAVGLSDTLARLSGGLSHVLGQGGAPLSGGESQRLNLARALYRDPELLVLDEPTSALDDAAEARIVQTLGHWKAGRTLVVVSHSARWLDIADHVVVLSRGRVLMQGGPQAYRSWVSGRPSRTVAEVGAQRP